ncbi:MAG: DUF4921 family protein [Candidatus Tectomicrobia bacterium]|uniref:DUF4921 family protein n=1 Tax=Tectimicrobiota bacterium TaxID=2528274 RepID=A0A932M0T9_UNCTE|nr:DUF4921 family protein [Candidatus Tectomicrobia bacterium]
MNVGSQLVITMADGTVKQTNPLTGHEAWFVPGRSTRPMINEIPKTAKPLERHSPEDYCNFCEANYLQTPPEKERLVAVNGRYEVREHVPPDQLHSERPLCRRIGNLFEIVTIDYWQKNYSYRLSEKTARWKGEYLSREDGLKHVISMVDYKLRLAKKSEEEIANSPIGQKVKLADAFFGGGHDLIVFGRHYSPEAQYDSQICSSGEMTQEEHFQYILFTTREIQDILDNNRYVRYVITFQNWRMAAGASFDHLHKQLVALDEWGTFLDREVELVVKNPNIYNELVANFAGYSNRVIAENDHAILFGDIGHRFPTLAVYSKSPHVRPMEHEPEEIRGVSDLIHAAHMAMGSTIPCNEEWYYAPRDCPVKIPWHILIKWRINTPAGFEGGTNIHINPLDPLYLRDLIVPRLYDLRDKKIIDGFKIAEECALLPNSLRYNQS